jgi:hypothetical protein
MEPSGSDSHRCGDERLGSAAVEVDVPAARALERHDREQQREADHGAADPNSVAGRDSLTTLS